jgi:hypothetical protein
MKKQIVSCVLFLFLFLFSGCRAAVPIEDLDVIIGLGLDLIPGITNDFENSAEYLVFKENREISKRVTRGISPTL